jgi:hypothetical protein
MATSQSGAPTGGAFSPVGQDSLKEQEPVQDQKPPQCRSSQSGAPKGETFKTQGNEAFIEQNSL